MSLISEIEQLPNFKAIKGSWDQVKNQITFINLLTRFYNICLNLFKWKGLPETCDVDYLEHALWLYGKAIFVKDKNYGFLSLRAMESGQFNIYRKCIYWNAYGFGGYHERYKLPNGLYGDDAVLIRNNRIMFPTANVVLEYLYDIADIKRAINVNVTSTKTPTIAYGDVDTIKSLKTAFKQQKENESLICVSGDLANKFSVNDAKKEFLADKLLILKHDMLSELLSFLGIKYLVTEKKERLLTDEANASEMFSVISIDTMYETRKQACNFINKQFGLNVSVEINYDIIDMIKEMQINETTEAKEEVEENE